MLTRLQTTYATHYDRYPEIFSAMRDIWHTHSEKTKSETEIISFGCSTGEEALCLKQKYFPHYNVTGADISDDVIAKAKKLVEGKDIKICHSKEILEDNYLYDIIFCMSVLCSMSGHTEKEVPLPFALFDEAVTKLHEKLSVGGYLVVYNSNYSIFDAKVGYNFVGIYSPFIGRSYSEVRRFNKLEQQIISDNAICIYKKIR